MKSSQARGVVAEAGEATRLAVQKPHKQLTKHRRMGRVIAAIQRKKAKICSNLLSRPLSLKIRKSFSECLLVLSHVR